MVKVNLTKAAVLRFLREAIDDSPKDPKITSFTHDAA